MDKTEAAEHTSPEMMRAAAQRARDRANAARWDLNVATALFGVLIVVIILVSQDAMIEIVAPIAVAGLAGTWFMGWRKGKKLYQRLYDEELSRLSHESATEVEVKSHEETVADAVQKALRERRS